jgi:bifunctional polynucleotide phosphatase/kinase
VRSYQVIVVSNQKKISIQNDLKGGRSESKSLSNFKEKALAVMRQLEIPLSIYAATQYDEYRKPRTGMWKEFLDDYDLDLEDRIDRQASFFVGDAAGRPGDHSCVDRYGLEQCPGVK